MININMNKARDIHRNRIRQAREPLFQTADVAYLRALETGNDVAKAQAAAVKQLLRDAPAVPEIEQATTPDELKAVWNESLLGQSPY